MDPIEARRPPWYLVTGLVIGIGLGLWVAWVLAPVEVVDTHPITLREEFKGEYRKLIAAAYVADGDLGRARARLALLGDPDPARTLASQAQVTLAEGGSQDEARNLGLLAAALAEETAPEETPQATNNPGDEEGGVDPITTTPTPDTTEGPSPSGTPTRRPIQTPTPLPTRTATPTPGAAFLVQDWAPICEESLTRPLIQVYAIDAAGQPVPGVEAVVTWVGGADHFFTGLKPEFGLGYADFEMTLGETYTLQLTDGGEPLTGLATQDCEGEQGERYWGSWRVTFVQP